MCGDYSKAKTELNWSPKTEFSDLIGMMVDADLKRNKLNIKKSDIKQRTQIFKFVKKKKIS